MESPATRLQRVLIGVVIALVFLTSISMSEGILVVFDNDLTMMDRRASVFPILSVLICVFILSLRRAMGREYGGFFLDPWISREDEEEMIARLKKEQEDTSVEKMGGAWAELEKVHLERSLEEE
tara:strand:+ start:19251 stop:19622 length:372 start_codon:yes stop_codon:yes gene_type:complete